MLVMSSGAYRRSRVAVGGPTSAPSSRNQAGRDWRRVCDQLDLPEVTTHSFRKSVATLISLTTRACSARIGADQLGHARPSLTQDVYMSRGKIHTQVAERWTTHKRRTVVAWPTKTPFKCAVRVSNPGPADYPSAGPVGPDGFPSPIKRRASGRF